ncbi:MAG: dethiobiotin synthase [Planctomycetaceae bacterium]
MRGLFITATDTGVGKTHLSTAIVRRLRQLGVRVGAYKPAASGAEEGPCGPQWADVERLYAALDGEFPRERICPQRFSAALAPPVAARHEGRRVDCARLREGACWWRDRADLLVVEGVGGFLSPLSETETNADLACDLRFPLLVVARRTLGTINHTLLTLEAAARRGLVVAGVILNEAQPPADDDLSVESNAAELACRISAPVLASFEHSANADLLDSPEFLEIDFERLAQLT